MITPEQFELLLPLASAWAEEQEHMILRNGVPLTEPQMTDARDLGIHHPDRVRLLCVTSIPLPEDPGLSQAAQATQLVTSETAGLTVRYGVFVRSDCWADRKLIVHELVHTSQYERLGGFRPFLQQYLSECISIGYPAAPLEQEAILKTQELIG